MQSLCRQKKVWKKMYFAFFTKNSHYLLNDSVIYIYIYIYIYNYSSPIMRSFNHNELLPVEQIMTVIEKLNLLWTEKNDLIASIIESTKGWRILCVETPTPRESSNKLNHS